MIRAILFDMDGVIVDSMRFHALSWKKVFAEKGVFLEDSDIFRREGMSGMASVEDIFREKGFTVPEKEAVAELIARKHSCFEEYNIKLYPLAVEILKFLKKHEMLIGLVTGSGRRAVTHSIPQDVLSLFDTIISSDDVKCGKPDPEPYACALGSLSLKAEEALVVENAPLGITSAVSAGICCYAIETTLPAESLKGACRVFGSHKAFFDYIQEQVPAGLKVF